MYNKKNIIIISIILLFLISSTFPLTAIQINQTPTPKNTTYKPPPIQPLSTIIYVDDDNIIGPWNGTINHPYQHIQDAILSAQPYDHIYVFNGTYYEHLHINKPLTIEGESNQHTTIDGSYISNVVTITAQNVTLAQFTIRNSGITTTDSALLITNHHVIIIENNIRHNYHGLIINTPNNAIIYNNLEDNTNHAYTTMNNTVTHNYWDDYTFTDLNENGIGDTPYHIAGDNITDPFPLIHRYGAIRNLNTNEIFFNIQSAINSPNTLPHHTIYLKPDIYHEHLIIQKPITLHGTSPTTSIIDGSNNNTVILLQTNTTTLTKLTIQHSGTNQIDNGIHINGHNNEITHTYIINNYIGIKLSNSENTNIIQNHITQNHWIGLIINHNSRHTTIHNNVIQSNGYAGIGINLSSDNQIYHNDFIDNPHNAYDDSHNTWDNDLPSGGNYWDDYTGEDKNNDGIGDTPYPIKGGINEDRYPFMYPLEHYDSTPPTVKIIQPTNGLYLRNHQLLSRILKKTIILGKITVKATAHDNESGITQINFYLNNWNYPVNIDYEPPYEWLWKRGTFLPDTHQIKVVAYNNAGLFSSDKIDVKRYL